MGKNPVKELMQYLKNSNVGEYVMKAREAILNLEKVYASDGDLFKNALAFSDDAVLIHELLQFLYLGETNVGLFLDEKQMPGNKDTFMQLIKETRLFDKEQIKGIEESLE